MKSEAEKWDEKYSIEEYLYTKTANRFVVEYCESLKGKTAIDLAGGEGRNTIWLAKQGFQTENVDFSQVALDKCLAFAREEQVEEKVLVSCADATTFTPKLGAVDLGVIAYLQIPERELKLAVARLAEFIAPGGHLVGVWHSRDNLAGKYYGQQNPDLLPNRETMLEALADSGVEVLVLDNQDGQIQTREGLKPSLTLVLVARRA